MQRKSVSSTGTNISGLAAQVKGLFEQDLSEQRGAAMPKTGVVANFDPDQRGFLTDAMKGLTNVQIGNGALVTNVLAAHADYGVTTGYQNPDTDDVLYPFKGDRQLRPVPGQPTVIYPVASAGGSISGSFIRGGKAQPYREYPGYSINRGGVLAASGGSGIGSLLYIRQDVFSFINPGYMQVGLPLTIPASSVVVDAWFSNSPLPPGMRWVEINDIIAENTPGNPTSFGQLISLETLVFIYRSFVTLGTVDLLLPQDRDGNIKKNYKPLPSDKWALHPDIYNDYTYWTGTVRNPVDWTDIWWYGRNNNIIDRDAMKTWLDAHPGAKFP